MQAGTHLGLPASRVPHFNNDYSAASTSNHSDHATAYTYYCSASNYTSAYSAASDHYYWEMYCYSILCR